MEEEKVLIGVSCTLDKNGFRLVQTNPQIVQGENVENYYYDLYHKLDKYLPKSYINNMRIFEDLDNGTLEVEIRCWFLNKVTEKDILDIKKRLLKEFKSIKKRIIKNLTLNNASVA